MYLNNKLVLIFIFSLVSLSKQNQDIPDISTSLGKFLGSIMFSITGKEIYSFRGIRYAKPPIDDLRFKPPEPFEYNNEIINATQEGPACPQAFGESLFVAEDCLMLNVYTRNLANIKDKKPVIVYMHPGGFYGVSGQSVFAGPKYLLEHDVVLVAINYRLGSLGFLSTGDVHAPGNNGFKDQVLALKWIKQNIAAFGGDPDSVTLVGYSAGSLSITLHMVSPMSEGLFHRAIAMSAASTANWKIPRHQLDLAKKQADLVGCPSQDSKEILDCLKTKDSKVIADSYSKFFEFRYNPILLWRPVIEPDCEQERFLTDNPIKLIQQGKFHKVPLILGITEYEFAGPAYDIIFNETLTNELNQRWEDLAPILFLYERNTERSKMISHKLKEFYLHSAEIQNNQESIKGLRKLFADGVISFGVHRFAKLIADYSDKPVYYYKFTYKGRYSHFYLPNTSNIPLGAVHHDDLLYLLSGAFFPTYNISDPEYKTVDRMTTMWTDFAKVGNPTPKALQKFNYKIWPIYENVNQTYFDIGSYLSIKKCLYCDRFALWDSLFPLPTN